VRPVFGDERLDRPAFLLRHVGNDDILVGREADVAVMVLRDAAQSSADRRARKILYPAVLDE
jgi:soluble P-type ATPase